MYISTYTCVHACERSQVTGAPRSSQGRFVDPIFSSFFIFLPFSSLSRCPLISSNTHVMDQEHSAIKNTVQLTGKVSAVLVCRGWN